MAIEDVLSTSTSPMVVITDAGKAVFKSPQNREGTHSLVREYIGTMLAKWLEIPTFEMRIFHSVDIDILKSETFSDAPGGGTGILFKWEEGVTWDTDSRVLDNITNKKDITKIVYLDTWIRNYDRFHPEWKMSDANRGNVFFSGGMVSKRFQIKAIDHSEAFKLTASGHRQKTFTIGHFNQDAIQDPNIYGLFPDFKSKLDFKTAIETQKRLILISGNDIENLMREIPDDWNLDQQMKDMFCSFIFLRARYVANTLCCRLFPHESKMLFE